MDGFELNKVAAAILFAGVTAMTVSMVTNAFYDPEPHGEEVKRGYQIEVADAPVSGAVEEDKPVQIAAFFADADIAKGEKLTKACQACHSFDQGGPNKVGPNLYNIVGADIAGRSGYSYSNALASFDGDWGFQELSMFLEKPKKYVKGTKMAYAGMKKPEDRADLILYLRSLSTSPKALPPVPVAEPEAEAAPVVENPEVMKSAPAAAKATVNVDSGDVAESATSLKE